MKKLQNTLCAVVLFISVILLTSISTIEARSNKTHHWKALLTGPYGAAIAYTPTTDTNAYQISFRHNLGEYAQLLLVVRHTAIDGVTRDIQYEFDGFTLSTLPAAGINTTIPANGIIEIIRLHLVYTRFGEHYVLDIDAEANKRSLTKSGIMYNYGPGLSLIEKVLQPRLSREEPVPAVKPLQNVIVMQNCSESCVSPSAE